MTCYGPLARVYDRLVQGVDFEAFADYVQEILGHFRIVAWSAADLACGTGSTALPLVRRGFVVTGVDISGEMLALAREKAWRLGLDLTLEQADMRSFSLPGPVDLVTCFHDGLNYLADNADLLQTFTRVRLALKPGGLFIFDLNTLGWLDTPGNGEEESVFTDRDWGLTWRSRYDRDRRSWQIDLAGWILEDGEMVPFAESHREQAFSPGEVEAALTTAGLSLLAVYRPFTLEPATPADRRCFYVARRPAGKRTWAG